jgi:hypothetical protein
MGLQFSAEEMEVLKQCEIESLVQRSIPIGTALGVAAYVGVQKGILAPSPKFGASPKMLGAAFLGFIIGKLSYQAKCAEKLMALPNSQVGEMLRRRKQGFLDNFSPDGGLSMSPFSQRTPQTDVYSDEGMMRSSPQLPQSSLDLDRPISFNGLDDTYRPSLDTPQRNFDDNLPLEPPKSTTSYEELRRKNRDDYNRRLSAPFQQQSNPPYSERDAQFVRSPRNDDYQQGSGAAKNKYGDEWK